MYIIWTDGSGNAKDNTIGYAALVISKSREKGLLLSSFQIGVTGNNQAELSAILLGIRALPEGETVHVITDSKNCIGWLSQGWKRNQKPIDDLVKQYEKIIARRNITITYEHVRGHSGVRLNHFVDIQAGLARANRIQKQEHLLLKEI
jgi:ribonuclease HI